MGNIIDYVKNNGKFSFAEMPFSEVDSLVLSQLSYMNLGSFETCSESFIAQISDLPMIDEYKLTENVRAPEKNIELLLYCAKSKRFSNVRVAYFVSETEEEKCEKQFAAMTFKLSDNFYYIAFRGTDASLVGWKEDFNLAYLKRVPSQEEAVRYFKKVAKKTKGKLILGGHSKGGNLAIFAASKASILERRRIAAVFDHDGPGFLDGMIKEKSLERISEIIYKTIPQTAIIGLLLGSRVPFTIVESKAFGILQHDPFVWQVEGSSFKKCESIDNISKFTAEKINNWLLRVDSEKRRLFVDSLYAAVMSTGAKTYFELFENKNTSVKQILKSLKDTDPEVKEVIKSVMNELIGIKKDKNKL